MTAFIYYSNVDDSKDWTKTRLAIGSAMFIFYFIHYIFVFLTYFKGKDLGFNEKYCKLLMKKSYLFGVGCLFSMNYL